MYERLADPNNDYYRQEGYLLQNSTDPQWWLRNDGFYSNGWVRNTGTDFGQEVVSVVTNDTTSTHWYVNGQDWTQDPTQTAGAPGRLALGGGNGRNYDPVYCQVSEVIVYDHALSESERQAIESYELARYALNDTRASIPAANPPSGTYYGSIDVALSSSTSGATIRFTTDGSDPTTSSSAYATALHLTADTVLKARAFKAGINPSSLLTEQYLIRQSPTSPVLWSTSAGGNGHYYRLVYHSSAVSWDQAEQEAEGMGGYLATITSAAENNFVFSSISQDSHAWNGSYGPFIGGFQPAGSDEPAGGWQWVNNEGSFSFTAWDSNQPDNSGGEGFLQYWRHLPAWVVFKRLLPA